MMTETDIETLRQELERSDRLDQWKGWGLSRFSLQIRARIAAGLRRHPERSMSLIAVTGTDGKTTPGPFVLQTLLTWMKRFRSDWVIIEASSHGLAQWRLGGLVFKVGVVTNLVLITGKGHERLLNVDGKEMPWDEEAVARDAIAHTQYSSSVNGLLVC